MKSASRFPQNLITLKTNLVTWPKQSLLTHILGTYKLVFFLGTYRFKGILKVTYACIKVPKHHIHEKQEIQMYKKFCNCQSNWISK